MGRFGGGGSGGSGGAGGSGGSGGGAAGVADAVLPLKSGLTKLPRTEDSLLGM
jgi:hypothetical protein